MKIRTPDYYDRFKCIAGACEDTCCAGWQVDVDDDTYEYYRKLTGPFGDRLHSVMIEPTKKAEGQFAIRENGRCPFLNDDNLCDLITELGEEALCVTCDQYPRYTTEFGNLRETGIALSCKTAAELILREDRRAGFTEYEDPNRFPSLNEIDGSRYLGVMAAREKAFALLADRSCSIWQRLCLLLYFATDIQKTMKHPERMRDVAARYDRAYCEGALKAARSERPDDRSLLELYDLYFYHYLSRTIIKKEWPELVRCVYRELYELPAPWEARASEMKAIFKKRRRTGRYPELGDKLRDFLAAYERSYEFENLAVYFTFRYFARGILDGDVLTKVKMGIVSILMILSCDAARYMSKGSLEFTDQVEITHLYSREVEHSEENFAALCKLMAHRREFSDRNLVGLLQTCVPDRTEG